MKINVTKQDFSIKPPEERDWMIYQGITLIHSEGCEFARDKCGSERWKRLSVIGAAIGSAVAFSIGILKFLHIC